MQLRSLAKHLCLYVALLCVSRQAAASFELAEPAECGPEYRLDASKYLDALSNGWRPLSERRRGEFGWVNEKENAQVIHDEFSQAGYSNGIAFAAIVNAWAESSLDNTAVMDDPFYYKGKYYPHGSGAIGLFQLLPSKRGAGGPAGAEKGYSGEFLGPRYAGRPWQARRYYDEPDINGRRYYNGADPRLNARRIVLEVERDGKRLVAADKRGASIAELSHIFGYEIERPQGSTWYRRSLAAEMMGYETAYAMDPENTVFAPERDWGAELEALAAQECEVPVRPSREVVLLREPVRHSGVPTFLGIILALGLSSVLGFRRWQ